MTDEAAMSRNGRSVALYLLLVAVTMSLAFVWGRRPAGDTGRKRARTLRRTALYGLLAVLLAAGTGSAVIFWSPWDTGDEPRLTAHEAIGFVATEYRRCDTPADRERVITLRAEAEYEGTGVWRVTTDDHYEWTVDDTTGQVIQAGGERLC